MFLDNKEEKELNKTDNFFNNEYDKYDEINNKYRLPGKFKVRKILRNTDIDVDEINNEYNNMDDENMDYENADYDNIDYDNNDYDNNDYDTPIDDCDPLQFEESFDQDNYLNYQHGDEDYEVDEKIEIRTKSIRNTEINLI